MVPQDVLTYERACGAIQFLALSTLLRGQPWGNRFFFLIIVFLAPVAAGFVTGLPRTLGAVVLAGLCCLALGLAVSAPRRGILERSWESTPGAGVVSDLASGPPRFDLGGGGTAPAAIDRAVGYAFSLRPSRFDLENTRYTGSELSVWTAVRARDASIRVDHGVREPAAQDRIVRICLTACRTSDLSSVRRFTDPALTAPVVVGLVGHRPSADHVPARRATTGAKASKVSSPRTT